MTSAQIFKVVRSLDFRKWLERLRDDRAQVAIERRIGRLEAGNFGDKSTQSQDIVTAHAMAARAREIVNASEK